jgi:hypothetical protein
LARSKRTQPLKVEDADPGILDRGLIAGPDCGQQNNRLVLQPASDEGQHLYARAIEPVHVIRTCDHGRRFRRAAKDLQGGHRDEEQVGPTFGSDAERRLQCLPLRFGQGARQPQNRAEQLMEAGESKLGFGLYADGRQGLGPNGGGLPARALQQSRLADARLAPDQDRAAAVRYVTDERVDDLRLFVASNQLVRGHDMRIGSDR